MLLAVLIRRKGTQRLTEGEGHVRTETEVTRLQAKERRGLPATAGGWKRHGRVLPCRWKGSPASTSIRGFGPPAL